MSSQHIQKNFPGLLHTPAKYENKGDVIGFHPTTTSNLRTALGVNSVLSPAFRNRFRGSFQICVARWVVVYKYKGYVDAQFYMRSHGSSLRGFPENILQGWFKMKTTSIFPVHGLPH